jgi:amino acid transporter
VFTAKVMLAILHTIIVFAFPLYSLQTTGIVNERGETDDLWLLSLASFTSLIFVVTIDLALVTRAFNIIVTVAFLIPSLLFYLLFMWGTNWLNEKMEDSVQMSH